MHKVHVDGQVNGKWNKKHFGPQFSIHRFYKSGNKNVLSKKKVQFCGVSPVNLFDSTGCQLGQYSIAIANVTNVEKRAKASAAEQQ